jgi:tRNA(Ile)-lysidine synthase
MEEQHEADVKLSFAGVDQRLFGDAIIEVHTVSHWLDCCTVGRSDECAKHNDILRLSDINMSDIVKLVTTYIEHHQLLAESGKVVVAVSGGADSLCLLHLLDSLCGSGKRYPSVELHVAHLDHQLRGNASARDADAVARLAASWELPVTIGTIDVPSLARREQRSLEDAARTARYRFLREVAQGQPIAVAHHKDDQVETLLLHWLRGGGIGSMVGLQPHQQDIIRPLLCVSHADTLAYCQQHGLTPLEDASNTDARFLRNRIRHELLPLLESLNPGIRATLLRNAEVMRSDAAWIEEQVDMYWPNVVLAEEGDTVRLSRSALLALPLSLQRHLLRRITSHLSRGQSPLELRHYQIIESLLHRENDGEELTLHLPHQLQIVCIRDTIVFEHHNNSTAGNDLSHPRRGSIELGEHDKSALTVILPIPGQVRVPGTPWIAVAEIIPDEQLQEIKQMFLSGQHPRNPVGTVFIASAVEDENRSEEPSTRVDVHGGQEGLQKVGVTQYAVHIDADHVGDVLLVRTRRPGDRIQPLGMAHEKKVQDVLVDKHIARSERMHIPLFFSESHCVWLAGVCLDERVRLTEATRRIVHLSLLPT